MAGNRSGATRENPFPSSRKGYLDYPLLKQLGLTHNQLLEGDALFLFQLSLPICDPKRSGAPEDPHIPFYLEVEKWMMKYAADMGLTGSYGHSFKEVMSTELLKFDMCLVRDGVIGGSDGAIHRRWKIDEKSYDKDMANAITYTWFLQLKRTYKLCDNDKAIKDRKSPHYNPAYKYDYIFKVLIHNLNSITKYADLDKCSDETTAGHGGYGEKQTGTLKHVHGKPHVTKGMQTCMTADVHRNRPRSFVHQHKCHLAIAGWNKEGPKEVRTLAQQVKPMVIGECQVLGV